MPFAKRLWQKSPKQSALDGRPGPSPVGGEVTRPCALQPGDRQQAPCCDVKVGVEDTPRNSMPPSAELDPVVVQDPVVPLAEADGEFAEVCRQIDRILFDTADVRVSRVWHWSRCAVIDIQDPVGQRRPHVSGPSHDSHHGRCCACDFATVKP